MVRTHCLISCCAGCPMCLYHFGGECSHSLVQSRDPDGLPWLQTPLHPGECFRQNPWLKCSWQSWEFLVISSRRCKKKLEFSKCLVCLPANSTGAIPGVVLPTNLSAVKQPGAKIPWLFIFSFAHSLIHTQLFSGRRKAGIYPWAWFGFFSWCH